MKKIDMTGPMYAGYYVLDNLEDYELAILDYLESNGHEPSHWGLRRFTLDALVCDHRVKGNRQSRERDYPQVLVINFIDEPNQLIVNFIPKSVFDSLVG